MKEWFSCLRWFWHLIRWDTTEEVRVVMDINVE